MSKFRRIFWNVKDAFLGKKFLYAAPMQALALITTIAVPIQLFMILQKGTLR